MTGNISLLPPEYRTQQQQNRKTMLATAGGGVLLLIMAVVYIALLWTTSAQMANQRALCAQKNDLEREIAGYREYEVLQLQVEGADRITRKAVRPAPAWSPLLASLGSRIPEGAWLEGFQAVLQSGAAPQPNGGGSSPASEGEQQQNTSGAAASASAGNEAGVPAGEGRQVTVTGWAFNHLLVADWLQSLQQDPYLEDVNCRYSSEKDYGGRPLIQFEINAVIRSAKSGPVGEASAT